MHSFAVLENEVLRKYPKRCEKNTSIYLFVGKGYKFLAIQRNL